MATATHTLTVHADDIWPGDRIVGGLDKHPDFGVVASVDGELGYDDTTVITAENGLVVYLRSDNPVTVERARYTVVEVPVIHYGVQDIATGLLSHTDHGEPRIAVTEALAERWRDLLNDPAAAEDGTSVLDIPPFVQAKADQSVMAARQSLDPLIDTFRARVTAYDGDTSQAITEFVATLAEDSKLSMLFLLATAVARLAGRDRA